MVHGGWRSGALAAYRPGHRATHAFVADALAAGLLARSDGCQPSAADCREAR
jgi:hypothetical protein